MISIIIFNENFYHWSLEWKHKSQVLNQGHAFKKITLLLIRKKFKCSNVIVIIFFSLQSYLLKQINFFYKNFWSLIKILNEN